MRSVECDWKIHFGLALLYLGYGVGVVSATTFLDGLFHVIMLLAGVLVVLAWLLLRVNLPNYSRMAFLVAEVGTVYGILANLWQPSQFTMRSAVGVGLVALLLLTLAVDDCAKTAPCEEEADGPLV